MTDLDRSDTGAGLTTDVVGPASPFG